jgi:hypothetical protein
MRAGEDNYFGGMERKKAIIKAALTALIPSLIFVYFYRKIEALPAEIDTRKYDLIARALVDCLKFRSLRPYLSGPQQDAFHMIGDPLLSLPFALFFKNDARMDFWRGLCEALPALWLTSALARRLYGKTAALAACLLLAASPSFVLYSHMTLMASIVQLPLLLIVVLAALDWLDTGRWPWAVLACAAFGLGLSCRSKFLAAIPGLAAAAWINRRRAGEMAPRTRSASLSLIALCALAPVLILVPLFALLCSTHPDKGSSWAEHLLIRGNDRGSNLDIAAAVVARLRQVRGLLDGTVESSLFSDAPEPFGRVPGTLALLAGFIAAGYGFVRDIRAGEPSWRRRAIPWMLALGWLPLALISPTALNPPHILPLLPLFFILACSPLQDVPPRFKTLALGSALLFCGWRTVRGAELLDRMIAEVRREPGLGAGDALARWSAEHPDGRLVLISRPVNLNSWMFYDFPISWDVDQSGEARRDEYAKECDLALVDPRRVFVLFFQGSRPSRDGAAHLAVLLDRARRMGLGLKAVHDVKKENGLLVCRLYRAQPAGVKPFMDLRGGDSL